MKEIAFKKSLRQKAHTLLQMVFIPCIVISLFIAPPFTFADTIELESGTVLTCVILKETASEYSIRTDIGKMTVAKEKTTNVMRQSAKENSELKKKWKEAKRAYNKQVKGSAPVVKYENGKRLIRYHDRWLSYEDYITIKKAEKLEIEHFIKEKNTEDITDKENRFLAENKEATTERIKQGQKDRSDRGNSILSDGEWFSFGTENIIAYCSDEESIEVTESLAEAAEYYFERSKSELGMDFYFAFSERIDIILIENDTDWKKATRDAIRIGNPHSISNHFFKEIYLDLRVEDPLIVNALHHEIKRMLLRELIISSFSKGHYVPLWLTEGVVSSSSPLTGLELPLATVRDAILKNYLIKFDELLMIKEYPTEELERKLFYMESVLFINFIVSRYGTENLNSFIRKVIELYNELAPREIDRTPQNARIIVKRLTELPFLKKDFSGFSSLEENWLKYVVKQAELKKAKQ